MPKDAAVEEFAGLVRALKARDGRSYEALGRRLSVSASTLHRYCSGATVPEEFAVVDRLALLCGAEEEERPALEAAWTKADRARRRAASPAPTPVPAVSAAPESNPEPSAPDPSAADPSVPEVPRARPRRGAPEQHIAEPGLVVLDITGGDEDTVRAVMAALEERWATSGVGPVRRDPGEPGVRARIYADVLRPGRHSP
ncbi:DUF6207 family protein [Streptomyces xanthophaeus]